MKVANNRLLSFVLAVFLLLGCTRNLNQKEKSLFNGRVEKYQDKYQFKITEANIIYLKILAKDTLIEEEVREIIDQLPEGSEIFHKMTYWNYANVYDQNGIFKWQIGFHSDTTIFNKSPQREFY